MARKSKRVSRPHPRKTKSSNKRTKKPRSSKKPYTHKKRKSFKKIKGGNLPNNCQVKKSTTMNSWYTYPKYKPNTNGIEMRFVNDVLRGNFNNLVKISNTKIEAIQKCDFVNNQVSP